MTKMSERDVRSRRRAKVAGTLRVPSAKVARRRRRGASLVEFAFVVPVFFLFVFAGVELARANMIRNTIENAAYEGARRGIVPGATADDCRDETQFLLDMVGIDNATVTVTPDPILATSETITVQVDVPMSLTNGYVTAQWFLGETLSSSITMPRELD